jgi:amidase
VPVPPPDPHDIAGVAESYRLGFSEADAQSYQPFVAGLLASWDEIERLYADIAPVSPQRAWKRPAEQDNPYNAWYVTTEITNATDGPLAGKTVAIKDNTSVAGVPMMNGSKTVEGYIPAEDATVVRRVLEAGATIVGKSVCEDLCFSGGSHTSRTGPVRNPWDESRTTSGSSSGNGALLAAGLVDLAIGGDQGGSIRMPAAFSGIVGHKPTHGLVPYTGAFPIEQTIDHLGPMARTVSDTATLLAVLAGADGHDPRQPTNVPGYDVDHLLEQVQGSAAGLRIGVVREGFGRDNSEPGVDETVRAAVARLREAGLVVEEVSIPWHLLGTHVWNVIGIEGTLAQMIEGNGYGANWQGRYDPDLIEHYGRQWRAAPHEFSQTVQLVLLAGGYVRERFHNKHYAMARNLVPAARKGYDDALASYDVLVMPTTPLTATQIPGPDAPREEVIGRALEMVGNTCPTDVTGHPACSVPAGLSDGLPVGMMIIGKHFDDATVLRVAYAFEQAVGGFPAPPVDK